jgi:hypothetical protein
LGIPIFDRYRAALLRPSRQDPPGGSCEVKLANRKIGSNNQTQPIPRPE